MHQSLQRVGSDSKNTQIGSSHHHIGIDGALINVPTKPREEEEQLCSLALKVPCKIIKIIAKYVTKLGKHTREALYLAHTSARQRQS